MSKTQTILPGKVSEQQKVHSMSERIQMLESAIANLHRMNEKGGSSSPDLP